MDRVHVLKSSPQQKSQVAQELISVYEACQELVIIYEESGRILGCNQLTQENLGYEQNIYETNIQDIFQKVFRIEDGQVKIISKYEKESTKTVAYCLNLSCIPVMLKVSYMEAKDGILGIAMARNMVAYEELNSEYKLASEQLEIMEHNQGDFLANITHELKTPLNGILGAARNLKSEGGLEDQRETIDIITSCCENMSKLIKMILTYSTLSSGKFEIEEERFDFRKMIAEVQRVNQKLLAEKNLRFRVSVSENTPQYMIGDPGKLNIIIMNLLSNAIKFTQIGFVTLDILTRVVDKDRIELFFSVMDTGIGIAKSDQEKLFHRFTQVDSSIKRKYGGTGLGLSITKYLVEQMDGYIDVESDTGKGSNFCCIVYLKQDCSSRDGDTDHRIGIKNPDINHTYTQKSFMGEKEIPLEISYLKSQLDTQKQEAEGQFSYYYIMRAKEFGTLENLQEIQSNMERIEICQGLEQWDRCETFLAVLKILIPESRDTLRKTMFQMELAVRRGDKVKADKFTQNLKNQLNEVKIGGTIRERKVETARD